MNSIIKKINSDEIINQIKNFAKTEEIFLVGGAIRDFFLGKENYDKDIVVEKTDARDFAEKLAVFLDGSFIPLDEENKIYRIMLKNKIDCVDVAQSMGENLLEDLRRRDLTINSVALNLLTDEIIDPNNGLGDLKNKIIRHIREENFIDDPLRLLRVFRFQAMLGFDVDFDLMQIVEKHVQKISFPAQERINYELLKLFAGKYTVRALFDMDKVGLLNLILPNSNELKSVPPNLHHHLNLFDHSIETVNQIQSIYEESILDVKSHMDSVDFGGVSRLAHLKLAAFLHDIGKPSTWTIEEETGRHRFIKHDDVGSKMVSTLLKKKKFSKKQIEYISKMVKNHIYPSHVVQAPDINEKIYMRLIRKMENDTIDVILLAMADRYSARGVEITEDIVSANIGALSNLLNFYLEIKNELKPLPKLLSGDEIMSLLGLKPSPVLGEIIKKLKEAQQNGEVSTKNEAEDFVKTLAV